MNQKFRRRTEISREKHEYTIIRRTTKHNKVFCEVCQKPIVALTVEKIAELAQIDLNEVCFVVQKNEFH